jgi:DNA-binding NarL/FixJ family response regulator
LDQVGRIWLGANRHKFFVSAIAVPGRPFFGVVYMRVLIADDHPLIRKGLRQTIESVPEFRLVGEASNGAEALRSIETEKPDVAVIDVSMPGLTGFELAAELKKRKLDCAIIFLTMHKDKEFFNKAMDLGARGYILKDSALDELVHAIQAVGAGKPFVSAEMTAHLMQRVERLSLLKKHLPGLDDLTPTEKRILKLISEYKTSKEIAEVLHIDYRTVNNHRTNIATKLGLQGSHAVLKFAIENQGEL